MQVILVLPSTKPFNKTTGRLISIPAAVPRLVQAPAGAGVMPAAGERGWTLAKADQGAVFFGKFRSKMGPYQVRTWRRGLR